MSREVDREGLSRNHLLSSLPGDDYLGLWPHLYPVKLSLGDLICDADGDLGYAYFPTTCVVSLICGLENGRTAEVALTGNDGVLGTSLILGTRAGVNRAIIGVAGEALRMPARIFKDQFLRRSSFQRALLRYTGALITQISLTAACNRVHTLEKRFCRWLLLIGDRTTSGEIVMTQEFLAGILGGRRETVTVAAGRLQDAGLIHYTRGRLTIMNRRGLEDAACECYAAVTEACSQAVGFSPQRTTHSPGDVSRKARASRALS